MSKGIILAGGSGSRLYPLTVTSSKQLLPIYDKPMIFHPLSTLMQLKIRDIMIISTSEFLPLFQKLLGDGTDFGINLSYKAQEEPKGIAESFIIGEDFVANDKITLILGDNIFYSENKENIFSKDQTSIEGAELFLTPVKDPERFGVAEIDDQMNIVSIEEKPVSPKSNLAITGLYMYDKDVVDNAKNLKPSQRGELEITDVNKVYLNNGKLFANILGSYNWFDTGTHKSLHKTSNFIYDMEKKTAKKIPCLEEISLENGWISRNDLAILQEKFSKTSYGSYLLKILEKNDYKDES